MGVAPARFTPNRTPVARRIDARTGADLGPQHTRQHEPFPVTKETAMLIKPRTGQKDFVRHTTRLYRENNETLFAYAKFIGEPTEYVLNQLLDTVLAKDRDFQTWLGEHPGSHVPKPAATPAPRTDTRASARPTAVAAAPAAQRA
jgi:hypothetical protein